MSTGKKKPSLILIIVLVVLAILIVLGFIIGSQPAPRDALNQAKATYQAEQQQRLAEAEKTEVVVLHVSYETMLICLLVAFIVGLIVGTSLSRPKIH